MKETEARHWVRLLSDVQCHLPALWLSVLREQDTQNGSLNSSVEVTQDENPARQQLFIVPFQLCWIPSAEALQRPRALSWVLLLLPSFLLLLEQNVHFGGTWKYSHAVAYLPTAKFTNWNEYHQRWWLLVPWLVNLRNLGFKSLVDFPLLLHMPETATLHWRVFYKWSFPSTLV